MLTLDAPFLGLEVGADRPAGVTHVNVRVTTLGRDLGTLEVPTGPGWHELRLDLPPDVALGPAYLRLSSEGVGGLRIRRIWSSAR